MNRHVKLGDDVDEAEIERVAERFYYALHEYNNSFLPAFDECNDAYRAVWRSLAHMAIWLRIEDGV